MELLEIPAVQTLFAAFDNRLRLVGGCVRDKILNILSDDIDLATPLTPDEMETVFHEHGIRFIETGRKHGTMTAIIDGKPYEITTLRVDEKTDGRHAKVAFTDSYTMDAHRRDFTINALYMDNTGHIYDYTNGLEDLHHRYVRFIGTPDERITEDYLRLLRYFRFWGKLGHTQVDESAVTACQKYAPHLASISLERKTAELMKILADTACDKTFSLMAKYHVLPHLIFHANIPSLRAFLSVRPKASVLEKLAVLTQGTPPTLSLSKAQKKQLEQLGRPITFSSDMKQNQLLLCDTGTDLFDFYIDRALSAQTITLDFAIRLRALPIKHFPLTPQDLLNIGILEGPQIAQKLTQARAIWADLDFTPDKKLVLKTLMAYTDKK